ncbi:MAG: chaperone NapD [Verrucomicrobiota bacterium]|jgi:nitrate reductase NapAB chaperone NapD|nr:chaperone NapD [Verrucomicrobiota bacterium]
MPISSYAIRCQENERDAVVTHLHTLTGITVGPDTDNGIPVVIESDSTQEARDSVELLEAIPGVESAVLVYHNFEDETEDS